MLLNCIACLQIEPDAVQKEAVEIKFGSPVYFDKTNNYFKFNYNGVNDTQIYLGFEESIVDLYLTDPKGERHYLEMNDRICKGNLTYNGTYYLEIVCNSFLCELGSSFMIIYPRTIETIDLSKNIYYQSNSYYLFNEYLDVIQFKVSNLTEEKYVYFEMTETNYYYRRQNVPYYPGEDPPYDKEVYPYGPDDPDFSNLTIFEVINSMTGVSTRNVRFYKFEPDTEYIINIHCTVSYWEYQNPFNFIYQKYMFAPFAKSQLKKINGNEGIIFSDGPIFAVVNSNNQKNFSLTSGSMMVNNIYYTKTEQDIENNLDLLSSLELELDSMLMFKEGETQNTFIAIMPLSFDSGINLYIADEVIGDCYNSYTIPANTSKIIYCDEEEKKGQFEYFNYVLTYKSDYKNMRIIFSDEKEATDYIIQNYLGLMVYVEKTDKDCVITMKSYNTKFAYFGAENSYIFNSFYSFGKKMLNVENHINIDNYLKLTQLNVRVGSEYIPWFEFYNIYFNQLDVKVNLFIRQLYGGSELYECDASDYDIHDLQFLTTPISNAKCKNKKSVFNRLFSLDGTRILSGYIAPDSYFDAYAEIKDDTQKEIGISLLMEKDLHTRNNAKYLKKDIEYKINFELNHLIKLEPGFDANIQITKGQTISSLNSQNPTVTISGEGYTMKSDKDAMVYFFGMLPQEYFAQKEIDIEKSKGKIIKISNLNSEEDFRIDFGFQNYCPTNIPVKRRIRDNGVLYLDNFYEKMKVKLVPNEKLYIYASSEQINKLSIEYIEKNLNNANNDYNIFLVPNNKEENTVIINTAQDDIIITDLYFCESNTTLKLSFLGKNNETEFIFTNNNFTEDYREFRLFRGDNKMTFNSNQPVIFAYSYLDLIDEGLFNKENKAYWNERKVLDDLIIEEVTEKNNNTIEIKFKPNYEQSSTRYIILIGQKNTENTLNNFSDPCYITSLLNQRPEGVKVEVIYDVGDAASIYAEVDISDISHGKNEFIVTIISQELRFEKKIKFYEPKEFNHEDQPSDEPSDEPTDKPTDQPTDKPSDEPSDEPTDHPTDQPTDHPTDQPTDHPTDQPTDHPTDQPTDHPTDQPTDHPTDQPTDHPTDQPTDHPTDQPTDHPTDQPTDKPNDNNTNLALAIALPIVGVLIIVIVVLIIVFRRKSSSSEQIEGMSKLNEMTSAE